MTWSCEMRLRSASKIIAGWDSGIWIVLCGRQLGRKRWQLCPRKVLHFIDDVFVYTDRCILTAKS
jgi:hypothetical protein